MHERADIAVVGLGAAGLMAAIWAGRSAREAGRTLRVVGLDGAARLGAKILVAGGGRCNVTHHAVGERDYAGSSPNAIKKVLRSFDVQRTCAFFAGLGVSLRREETGKLFPVTDRGATVLEALVNAAREAGAELRHPARVERIERSGDADPTGFRVVGPWGQLHTARVILATGGMALPRSGSDGVGYTFARHLGHSITSDVFPALVPLKVESGWFLTSLSGVAAPATSTVWSASDKRLIEFTDPVLCTHFGLSGPAILNVSRFLAAAHRTDPGAWLSLNWLPGLDPGVLDRALIEVRGQRLSRVVGALSRDQGLPARLIDALCLHAGAAPDDAAASLTREQRRRVVESFTRLRVPVTGDRGFTFAEVTAGGIPLSEVRLDTMESRVCPGLHLCGEILDVDGRIGGFNFQWAWASGFLAGRGGAAAAQPERH